ncbi:MAG: hypothetical protein A3H27_13645 [Acidobacteria bacterium RIFCSPLOWO2_02_FULL_59_13]|nr:MAG: hypothetical protein A3H27_13645 [Acidobacteria bacterium RIFCSPLOWO2_02_FULL_59_13]
MRLAQLRHLLATVEHGSIRGAARALDVAPPAVTRSIRELEQELGIQLLERTAHGVVPTVAGKAFLARARTVQNELARMREDSAQLSGGAAIVKFGYGPPAMPLLSPALASFRRQYPTARVRMVVGLPPALLPRLREGELEFVIGPLRPAWTQCNDKYFKTYPLYRIELVVVARRGHPLRNARSLAELSGADWLLYGEPFESSKDSAGKALPIETALPAPRSVTQCTDSGDHVTLLAESDMLSIHNQHCWAHGTGGLLEAFPVKLSLPGSTIHVFVRGDSPLTPAASAMVSAIKREARRFNSSGREARREETSVTTAALV